MYRLGIATVVVTCGCSPSDYPLAASPPVVASSDGGPESSTGAVESSSTGSTGEPGEECIGVRPGVCWSVLRVEGDAANVAIVDVDGDGREDLLATDGRWWRSSGSALDEPAMRFEAEYGAVDVVRIARDEPVVAWVTHSHDVFVHDLRREGAPDLGHVQEVGDVVLLDTDGDGRADLVQADAALGVLRVAFAHDEGLWSAQRSSWPNDLRITDAADLDGDGDHELVAVAVANDRIEVHGLAMPVVLAVGDLPHDAVVLPGPSGPRLVVALVGAGELRVFDDVIGRPTAYVTHAMNPAPFALTSGDVDGDGAVDLVVVDWAGVLHVLVQEVAGTLVPLAALPIASAVDWLDTGDVDGDGRDDVLLGDKHSDVLELVGLDGASLSSTVEPVAVTSAALGDLEGDAAAEVVILGYGLTVRSWPRLRSSVVLYDDVLGFNPGAFAVLDVDGDGAAELVACGDQSVAVLAADTYRPVFAGTAERCGRMWLADTSGDGLDDLQLDDGTMWWWRGDGLGRFGRQDVMPVGAGPMGLARADVDGDGDEELLVSLAGERAVLVLEREPSGWLERTRAPLTEAPGQLTTGDLDGDGRIDVVVVLPESGRIAALFQDDVGGFSTRSGWSASATVEHLHVMDLDHDGRDDVLTRGDLDPGGIVLLAWMSAADGFEDAVRLLDHAPYAFVGDLHGDGVDDLVVVSGGEGILVLTP